LDSVLLSLQRSCTIRTLSNDAGLIKLRELIDAVREEPVTVLEHGEPVTVVLSPAEFDRLEAQDQGASAPGGSRRSSGRRPSAE
jgi:prevent-host-death family protein